jgi:mycothiol synthase
MTHHQTGAALLLRQLNPASATDEELTATHRFLTRMRAEAWPHDPPRALQAILDSYRSLSIFSDLSFTIWQAWDGFEVVGEAFVQIGHYPDNRHLLNFTLSIRPEYRRQGLGTALLSRTVEVAQREGRRLLLTETDSMAPAGDAFAERAGFRRGLATHFNQLELSELDDSLLYRWQEQGLARASAFELGFWGGALPEEVIEEAAALYQIMNTEPRDTLDVEDDVVTPSQLRQGEAYDKARKVERWVFYLRDRASGQLVGFTSVSYNPENPALIEQLGTGVLPAYRGLGLGKWLKAAMLLKVLHERPQVKRIRTGNADSNAAMLGINRALGFKPYKAETVWQADLKALLAYLRSRPDGVVPF